MRTNRLSWIVLAAAPLAAQSYDELTFVRNKPRPYASVLELQGGMLASKAESEDETIGHEGKTGIDGHAYWRQAASGAQQTAYDLYGGRDGVYAGATNGTVAGRGTITRLELSGRLWPFYREGFYRGDHFIPTGRYEGKDWGGGLSASRELGEGARLELGGYYRRFMFERSDVTATSFTVPEDYNTYGARIWVEQSTLKLNDRTGRPDQGFLATFCAEREWNDSNGTMGIAGAWQSTLPNAFWRGRVSLDWYFPSGEYGTFEVLVRGEIMDDQDRVHAYDAQKPVGHTWVDMDLGYRIDVGDSFFVTPLAKGQFVRILDEFGVSTTAKTFFGGGVRAELDVSNAFSLLLDYSYLNNESRPPVATSEDTFGEHLLFVGARMRFGGK